MAHSGKTSGSTVMGEFFVLQFSDPKMLHLNCPVSIGEGGPDFILLILDVVSLRAGMKTPNAEVAKYFKELSAGSHTWVFDNLIADSGYAQITLQVPPKRLEEILGKMGVGPEACTAARAFVNAKLGAEPELEKLRRENRELQNQLDRSCGHGREMFDEVRMLQEARTQARAWARTLTDRIAHLEAVIASLQAELTHSPPPYAETELGM